MLSRMNFAATLTTNQRVNLRNAARPFAKTPQSVLSFVMDRLSPTPFETAPYNELLGYLRAGTNWTGSDNELQAKVAGSCIWCSARRTTRWFRSREPGRECTSAVRGARCTCSARAADGVGRSP